MSAEQRRAAAIVGSLVLCAPALAATLNGGLALGQTLVRYAAALCLSWCAVAAIERLVAGYRTGRGDEAVAAAGDAAARGHDRRASDRCAGGGQTDPPRAPDLAPG